MSFQNPSDEQLRQLLRSIRRIAVVGLSPKVDRPSHRVAGALQRFDYQIVPVVGRPPNAPPDTPPKIKTVLGEPAYATLEEMPQAVDLVDVFRAPQYVDAIVDSCIALGIPAIWLQEGVVNETAARRARAAGMTVVMDRCTYKEYARLFAGGTHRD